MWRPAGRAPGTRRPLEPPLAAAAPPAAPGRPTRSPRHSTAAPWQQGRAGGGAQHAMGPVVPPRSLGWPTGACSFRDALLARQAVRNRADVQARRQWQASRCHSSTLKSLLPDRRWGPAGTQLQMLASPTMRSVAAPVPSASAPARAVAPCRRSWARPAAPRQQQTGTSSGSSGGSSGRAPRAQRRHLVAAAAAAGGSGGGVPGPALQQPVIKVCGVTNAEDAAEAAAAGEVRVRCR